MSVFAAIVSRGLWCTGTGGGTGTQSVQLVDYLNGRIVDPVPLTGILESKAPLYGTIRVCTGDSGGGGGGGFVPHGSGCGCGR